MYFQSLKAYSPMLPTERLSNMSCVPYETRCKDTIIFRFFNNYSGGGGGDDDPNNSED